MRSLNRANSGGIRVPLPAVRRLILAVAVGLVGAGLLAIETAPGVGLGPDSFDYLSAAESLARGAGLGRTTVQESFRPLTHFPPGYPIVIGLLARGGISLEDAARFVNLAALAGLAGLGFAILWQTTGSWLAGGVGGILIALSPIFLSVSSWAMSEPLFLVLEAATLVCLGVFLQRGSWRWLLAAGAGAGLASITRYAGVALVLGCWIPILVAPHFSRSRRVRQAVLFTGVALLPLAVWARRNLAISGSAVDRVIAWHPPALAEAKIGLRNILAWLVPKDFVDSWSAPPRYGLGIILVVLLLLTLREVIVGRRDHGEPSLAARQGLFLAISGTLVAYAVILTFTMTLVDRLTSMDARILSPGYFLWLILSVAGLFALRRSQRGPWRRVAAAAVALWILSYGFQTSKQVLELSQDGQGYASRAWRASPTMDWVRRAPVVPIYTNDLAAIFFLTRRTAGFIPVAYNPATGQARADYPDWLASMRTTLAQDHGILVLFGGDPLPFEPEMLTDLTENLTPWARFPDGAVYGSGLVPSGGVRLPYRAQAGCPGVPRPRLRGGRCSTDNSCPLQ